MGRFQKSSNELSAWKIIWLLRHIPHPKDLLYPLLKTDSSLDTSKETRVDAIERAWLELSGLKLNDAMLRYAVPYFVEEIMDSLPNSELFSDFLYAVFNRGHYL